MFCYGVFTPQAVRLEDGSRCSSAQTQAPARRSVGGLLPAERGAGVELCSAPYSARLPVIGSSPCYGPIRPPPSPSEATRSRSNSPVPRALPTPCKPPRTCWTEPPSAPTTRPTASSTLWTPRCPAPRAASTVPSFSLETETITAHQPACSRAPLQASLRLSGYS